MKCLFCHRLIIEFAEATTRYSIAVDHMAQVAGLDRQPSFFEAHNRARREFEKCSRAYSALERHRSWSHLSRNESQFALESNGASFIHLEGRPA